MSSTVTEAFVKQFSANVFHLSQQKGSRLQNAVRNEQQVGKSAFYDRVGAATAIKKTSRHEDTPQIDTPHSRRRVTMEDYIYADLVDSADKIRMLNDPTSEYAIAAMWALGRSKDDEILDKASGTAYSGEEGSTSVTMPNSQKLASVSATAGADLNVQALRRAKKILDGNDVDESIPRFIAINASALSNLLGEEEVSSSDYNTVKALVQGELDTFLGFKFIRTERLNAQDGTLAFDTTAGTVGAGGGDADGYTQCIAWAMDGLLLSTGMEVRSRIEERPDKNFSTQVYAEMAVGSTRMEEEKVVEILCAQ